MSRFALKDVVANPFRHIDRYPIRREKVVALRESFHKTGFWDNVVARKRDGRVEIAYGHHRLVALREEYDEDHEIDLIIRDISDEAMIQIMAGENMEEWGTSAAVEHETVRAVVEAYGEGRIELEAPGPSTPSTRFAPSFVVGNAVSDRPYNAQVVASFLGWVTTTGVAQEKVSNALAALDFIERGILSEADFDGLTTMQAHAVLQQARRVVKERERLAQLHEKEAEAAAQRARAAEERRVQAESERREREAEAAKARHEAERRASEEAARRAERARVQAEEDQRIAEKRQKSEEKRSKEERHRASRDATKAGQAVSREIKAGRIGYKAAEGVARQVAPPPDGPPPMLDDLVRRLSADLTNVLDAQRDSRRVDRLDVFIQYRGDIEPEQRSDLVVTLRRLAERAEHYATQLERGAEAEAPRLPTP